MTAITAIIVDDERLARRELRSMLAEHPAIEIVGEAENAARALALIRDLEPDLVFLDIQMPGQSGFDLLDCLERNFQIIFITAYDTHAIRAFEVNALDYLLKPINPERLAGAIERLKAKSPGRLSPARKLEYDDRLFLEIDERSRFVKISAIVSIAAAGDYSEITTSDGQKLLTFKSLKEWEERLPEKYFARIHRSTIINLEYVESVESWFNRSYQIRLRSRAEPFVVSRRYAAKIRLQFG